MEQVDIMLKDLLCRVGMDMKRLKPIIQSVLHAMLRMKKEKVTHGDMHSDNIGFYENNDGTYDLVFIDFGQSSTKTNNVIVDAEQLISELYMIDNAPQAPIFASWMQWFIQKYFDKNYKLFGTRKEFIRVHTEYGKYIGTH